MKPFLTLFLAGLFVFPAQAARRVGEAQVRADTNGQPCFTISEREEKRSGTPEFQAIAVRLGERIMWHMTMPGDRTFPLSFDICIPYGGRVPALPQTPAAALADGKIYTVRVKVRPGGNRDAPLRYEAHFAGGNPGSMQGAGVDGASEQERADRRTLP